MLQALNEKPKKPKLIVGDSGNLIRKSKTTAMPCLTDKNYETFSTLNQDESHSNISRTKTRFDISFKTQSSKHVITSPSYALYPDKNYEINTLCKEEHECMFKNSRKNVMKNYIEKLEDKMINVNEQIKKKKYDNDVISEENLKLIFEQDKIAEEREFLKRQIPLVKESIAKIRNRIIDVQNETNSYEVNTIKSKEEILIMQERIKKLKIDIENQIKENTKIKYELQNVQKNVTELKQKLNPKSERYRNFIKDITKLISTK